MATVTPTVTLRPLGMQDLEHVLRWANDQNVVGRFHNFHPNMTRAEEAAYIARVSTDPAQRVYIIEDGYGNALGQTGLHEIANGTARTSIMIGERSEHGKGYGTAALSALVEKARDEGIHTVIATVRTDNAKMQHILATCDFTAMERLDGYYEQDGQRYDMIRYERTTARREAAA